MDEETVSFKNAELTLVGKYEYYHIECPMCKEFTEIYSKPSVVECVWCWKEFSVK